jgi:ubiquitin-conjugating enzyme E2 variant
MKNLLTHLLQLVSTILAADFATGLFHWLEDAYVGVETPLVGKIIAKPNILHHHYPSAIGRHSWWKTSRELILASLGIIGIAALFGHLNWEIVLFSLLVGNSNEFHKWAHRTRGDNGPVIAFLHRLALLQGARHHSRHHTDPKDSHYCTITVVLNPLLDRARFWARLEGLLARALGWQRRVDTSVRGFGPGPAWLGEFRPNPKPQTDGG